MRFISIISSLLIGYTPVSSSFAEEPSATLGPNTSESSPLQSEASTAPPSEQFLESARERLEGRVADRQLLREIQGNWDRLRKAWPPLYELVRSTRLSDPQNHSPVASAPQLNLFAPLSPQFQSWPLLPHARLPSGRAYKQIPQAFLRNAIPLAYRIAEWFGDGTNQVHLIPSFEGAHLLNDEFKGHQISSRLAVEFVGTFTDTPSSETVETFRFRTTSSMLVASAVIRLSEEVKPHHRGIREFSPESALIQSRTTQQQWFSDLMKNYPTHARAVSLPMVDAYQADQLLKSITERNLTRLRKERGRMIGSIRSIIEETKEYQRFNSLSKEMVNRANTNVLGLQHLSPDDLAKIPYEKLLTREERDQSIPRQFRILHLLVLAAIAPADSRPESSTILRDLAATFPCEGNP